MFPWRRLSSGGEGRRGIYSVNLIGALRCTFNIYNELLVHYSALYILTIVTIICILKTKERPTMDMRTMSDKAIQAELAGRLQKD
jgi:hypothetical protein